MPRPLTTGSVRPLAGAAAMVVIVVIIGLAVSAFRGSFTTSVPVTVLSSRAGLLMNPDARVKMDGVQVGTVASIEYPPDGTAAIHLAIDPGSLPLIPDNVHVDIASTTVFGAKYVQLIAPEDPSSAPLREGQAVRADRVTVEINTVFEQLRQLLRTLAPQKVNEVLTTLATTLSGRGEQLGQTIADFAQVLATLEPSLPTLAHDLEVAPTVLNAYADATPTCSRSSTTYAS